MRDKRVSPNPLVGIAGAGVFGALASMVTIILGPSIQPAFPILFYLKFDFAEVVDMVAFLVFGPVAGVLTATVHFIILSFAPGGTGLFGASLKYLAVLATYGGVILVSRISVRSFHRTGILFTGSGLIVRVLLMTVVNYAYIVVLSKTLFNVDYAGFAQGVLSQAGVNLTGAEFVAYVLALTAVFNAVHAIFTVTVSLLIVGALLTRASQYLESRAWIAIYLLKGK